MQEDIGKKRTCGIIYRNNALIWSATCGYPNFKQCRAEIVTHRDEIKRIKAYSVKFSPTYLSWCVLLFCIKLLTNLVIGIVDRQLM